MKSELMECRNCLGLASRSASRAISAVYDRHLRPHGLRGTQFSLLTALMALEQAPIGELARFLIMDRTTLTRNLALLEEKGWAERRTDDADARSQRVFISAAGEKMVRKAFPAWRAAQAQIAALAGPDGAATLRRLSKAGT